MRAKQNRLNLTIFFGTALALVVEGFAPFVPPKASNKLLDAPTSFVSNVHLGSLKVFSGREPGVAFGEDGSISATAIYFEIAVSGQDVGRLIFDLMHSPSPLPLHTENIIQLVKGSRRGIDPKAHYIGCEFDFSPASVEDGMGRYRWAHQLRGRGRNAVGRADQAIVDVVNQRKNTHACFGGQYYGMKYEPIPNDPGVLLTVPVLGPGHGSSKFSIIRVGESPKEWRDRLLINSGVIGKLRPQCLPVLHAMARQRVGPPTVVSSGVLDADQ